MHPSCKASGKKRYIPQAAKCPSLSCSCLLYTSEVRALAKEQYEMRFPPKRLEDIEDNFDFLDEDDLIE